jgi:uncharacterized protein (DUF433 family)
MERTVQLEDYFEFLETKDIRIQGTRIGIEVVIEDFLDGASPEEIAIRYPSLSLEQIYATITYYLANQQEVEIYLEAGRRAIEQAARAQEENPPEVVKRLRRLRQEKA